MAFLRFCVLALCGFVAVPAFGQGQWTIDEPADNAQIFYQAGIDANGECPSGTMSGYIAVYRENPSESEHAYSRIEIEALTIIDGQSWIADLTRTSGEWPMGVALVVVSPTAPPQHIDTASVAVGSVIFIAFIDEG